MEERCNMIDNFPHDYMERCPFCREYLLYNQIKNHVCKTPLITVKEIPVVFSYNTTDDNGYKVTIARGFDGILYRLLRCKNPIADEKKHLFRTDGDVTEPSTSLFKGEGSRCESDR
jgi:hypothetical protein